MLIGTYWYKGAYYPLIKIGRSSTDGTDRFYTHINDVSYPISIPLMIYDTYNSTNLETEIKRILSDYNVRYNKHDEVYIMKSYEKLFELDNGINRFIYEEAQSANLRKLQHDHAEEMRVISEKNARLESDKETLKEEASEQKEASDTTIKIIYQQLLAAVGIMSKKTLSADEQEILDTNQQVIDYVKETYPVVEEEDVEEN